MKNYENNAYFWQKVDALYLTNDFILINKKGQRHSEHPELIYPLNYGILKSENQTQPIGVFKGSKNKTVEAIAISADILEKTIEVKLFIGLNEEEEEAALSFLDQSQYQKTVLIRRGKDIPYWINEEIM